MNRYIILLLSLLSATLSLAEQKADDYNVFSRMSSEQLLQDGRRYFEEREAGKAVVCFSIICERYDEDSTPEETELAIRAMNNCGCVYKYLYYDYSQAYKYLSEAYELCERKKHEELLSLIIVNLGDLLNDYSTIYGSVELSQQAADLFNQTIDNAFEHQNWELLTTSFFNLSSLNYELDLSKYHRIFSEDIPDSTPDIQYIRLQYKGLECIQQKRYAEARQYFQQQFGVVSARWQSERDTLSTLLSIAKTYELERDYVRCADFLSQALQLSTIHHLIEHQAGIYKQLAACYAQTGDSIRQRENRLAYLEKMEEMHSSRLNNIAELRYLNELKHKETEAKEMSLRQQQQQYAILAIAIVLLVVIISAFLLWRQNRTLHARNKSLVEKYRQVLRAEAAEHELRKLKETATQDTKYSHSRLNDTQREALLFRIQEVLDNPDFICQQDFTLSQLSKFVDSNTTYVSQVINERYGMTFSNLLGSFRVKEACRRIDEGQQYSNLTIEAIASNIGFKSRTAFINAFKREVGLTPSEYIRIAESSKNEKS